MQTAIHGAGAEIQHCNTGNRQQAITYKGLTERINQTKLRGRHRVAVGIKNNVKRDETGNEMTMRRGRGGNGTAREEEK
jgi:hypothetical protein